MGGGPTPQPPISSLQALVTVVAYLSYQHQLAGLPLYHTDLLKRFSRLRIAQWPPFV